MKKIMAIFLTIAMIMTGLMIIPEGITQDAKATTFTITADPANCGWEQYGANSFWDAVNSTGGGHSTSLNFGVIPGGGADGWNNATWFTVMRGIIGFNTSLLPAGEILSVQLHTKSWTPYWASTVIPDGSINVYSRPGTETTFNWTEMYNNYTYEDELATTDVLADATWYSTSISPLSLGVADFSSEYGAGVDTALYITSTTETIYPVSLQAEVFIIDTAEMPYLTIVLAATGTANLRYYSDMATYFDSNIFPVENLPYNNTHDLIRFEVFVMNYTGSNTYFGDPINWMELTLGSNYTFISCDDYLATVTTLNATSGVFNITDYLGSNDGGFPNYPDHYMMLWFAREKPIIYAEVNIALWHSTLGEGFDWTKFKVMRTDGTSYNSSTAQWISNPRDIVIKDHIYTYTVMDYFNNPIVNKTINANAYIIDCLITVPIYAVYFNSLRNDTTLYAVYFNGTGMPFQGHTNGYRETTLALRSGYFMFRFDYMQSNASGFNTLIKSFFYNVTINATHTFNLGQDKISVLITLINGANYNIANIITGIGGLYPNVVWNLTDPIFSTSDTRSPSGVFTIADKSYLIIMSTADFTDIDTTAGATTLWAGEIDQSLLYGHWSFISDTLFIAASNTTAQMRVNDTTLSTTLISSTAPAGATYDLFTNNQTSIGNNISVWVSAGGFSIRREIEFHWARELTWTYDGSSKYDCFVTLNNTLPLTLRSPKVMVTFPKLQDPKAQVDVSQIYLYDTDHNVYMSPYSNFSRYADRIDWGMASISPTTLQHYKVTFYTNNETRQGTETITPIAPPDWFTYKGKDMRMVEGDYTNGLASTFEGSIIFIMTDPEANDIIPDSLIVIDKSDNTELTPNIDYLVVGTTIQLLPAFVGDMHTGDTVSIRVVYLTTETSGTSQVTQDTILGIPLYMLIFIILIMFGGIAAVLYLSKKQGRKEAGKMLGQLVIAIGVIAALIMFVLSTVGLIHV
jgi:hypothetical protein